MQPHTGASWKFSNLEQDREQFGEQFGNQMFSDFVHPTGKKLGGGTAVYSPDQQLRPLERSTNLNRSEFMDQFVIDKQFRLDVLLGRYRL